jgi:hypothetical protein
MKYKIIQNDNKDDFEKEVKNKIEDGWKLAGGIHVVVRPNDQTCFYQAIYKED